MVWQLPLLLTDRGTADPARCFGRELRGPGMWPGSEVVFAKARGSVLLSHVRLDSLAAGLWRCFLKQVRKGDRSRAGKGVADARGEAASRQRRLQIGPKE